MTGSYVLEIPGPTKEDREYKAVALAAEMRKVFAEDISVRIDRPTAVVRIRGLDEAVTVEEVVAIIANRGVAKPEEIRVSINRPTYGMGVAWVRCPVRAADDLAKAARIRIGWTTVRVELAAARPAHCFRCWGERHVASRCRGVEDRSRTCYRCRTVGHTAASCQAAPYCRSVAEAGREADHRRGQVSCGPRSGRAPPTSATPARGGTGRGGAGAETPQQRQRQRQQQPQGKPRPLRSGTGGKEKEGEKEAAEERMEIEDTDGQR